jgi:hypothetical protein
MKEIPTRGNVLGLLYHPPLKCLFSAVFLQVLLVHNQLALDKNLKCFMIYVVPVLVEDYGEEARMRAGYDS